MKRVVKLTESQLTNLIKSTVNRIISEQGPTADDIYRNLYGEEPPASKEGKKTRFFYGEYKDYFEKNLNIFKQNYQNGTYNNAYKQVHKGLDSNSKAIFDEISKTNEPLFYGIIFKFHSMMKNYKIKNVKVSIIKVGNDNYQIDIFFNKVL